MRWIVVWATLGLELLGCGTTWAQPAAGMPAFHPPLDIPMVLAGNFGELRSNHFHAGIDIKTNQVEGLPVYAAESGYISRIKISLYGYGKVIYVTHPNGYTTVYAHLQRFNERIEQFVKTQQYARQRFEIELFPGKDALPVTRAEVIAFSGNTGGSGGPHLHFEIRKTAGEVPVNPLLFGFDIRDTRKPVLKTLSLYPLNDTSTVNGKHEPLHLALRGSQSQGSFSIPGPASLKARGVIGIGLETVDYLNGAPNRCGVYSIELFADGKKTYGHVMDEIPFALTRYINSHIDYATFVRSRKRVQKSFLEPNNRLNIYQDLVLNGKLFFSQFGHDLQYLVTDAAGNQSRLAFSIDFDSVPSPNAAKPKENGILFPYNQVNAFESEDLKLTIPAFALYNNLYFTYRKEPALNNSIAPVYHLHLPEVPLHSAMEVQLTLDSLPKQHTGQLMAVSLNKNGRVLANEGGKLQGNRMVFRTRSFGPYTVMIDSVAPTIRPRDLRAAQNLRKGNKVIFTIRDNLSGIDTYNGYINGQWILMEYDRKTREFWYEVDPDRLEPGQHSLTLSVTDEVGNEATYSLKLTYPGK